MKRPAPKKAGPPRAIRFRFADGTLEEMPLPEYQAHLSQQMLDLATSPHSSLQKIGEKLLTETAIQQSKSRRSGRAGSANVAKSNDSRKVIADRAALDVFNKWRNDVRRKTQIDAMTSVGQIDKYLKVARPADRMARRLRAMVKDGRIK